MLLKILILPGDGIGSEVTSAAVSVLTGGVYVGTPRGIGTDRAVNTMIYARAEIERLTRKAFQLARARRRNVTSVDKSNVIENSQLWRRVVIEIAREYPDVELDH